MQHHDNDVFGHTVNTAARLAALAKARSITTDAATVATVPKLVVGLRKIGAQAFAGIANLQDCVELLWTTENQTADDPATPRPARRQRLFLRLREQDIELPLGAALRIGRSADCDLICADERVSQLHATIGSSASNFILADVSTHGTTVLAGGRELQLRREKTLLSGSGQIFLGTNGASGPERTIEYELREEPA